LYLISKGDEIMVYYWDSTKVSIGTGTIAAVYSQIATNPSYGFPTLGWTGIQVAADVHAWNGKLIIVAVLLPISGSDCWLVVSSAGDGTEDQAKENINIATGQIKTILNDYF
jgi:hypothetical protein